MKYEVLPRAKVKPCLGVVWIWFGSCWSSLCCRKYSAQTKQGSERGLCRPGQVTQSSEKVRVARAHHSLSHMQADRQTHTHRQTDRHKYLWLPLLRSVGKPPSSWVLHRVQRVALPDLENTHTHRQSSCFPTTSLYKHLHHCLFYESSFSPGTARTSSSALALLQLLLSEAIPEEANENRARHHRPGTGKTFRGRAERRHSKQTLRLHTGFGTQAKQWPPQAGPGRWEHKNQKNHSCFVPKSINRPINWILSLLRATGKRFLFLQLQDALSSISARFVLIKQKSSVSQRGPAHSLLRASADDPPNATPLSHEVSVSRHGGSPRGEEWPFPQHIPSQTTGGLS